MQKQKRKTGPVKLLTDFNRK